MATQFSIPNEPPKYTKITSTFLGVDYSNDPSNVSESRSPHAPNMIRSVPGKVRKCLGYHKVSTYTGRINGAHVLRTADSGVTKYTTLIHAGTKLIDKATGSTIYSSMHDDRSRSWQMQSALWIMDGQNLLKICYEAPTSGTSTDPVLTVHKAQDIAYIPTLSINKDAKGGGESHEALNLLTPKFIELFFADGTSTVFYLSETDLDNTVPVVVKVLNQTTGNWDTMAASSYTVNYSAGTVTFSSAPAAGTGGESNVSIQAGKTIDGYLNRILKCTVGTLYGISGMPDRLFASGNPDMINYDWYSEQYDLTYWPDSGYSVLGSAASAVMGYAIINNYLGVYKDQMELDRNIIFRLGKLNDQGDPQFPITNELQGPGTIGKWAFGYLENEPLNLTPQGVYALTTSDITGERYSQNRSWYIDGALLKESNLKDAYACIHNNMYWLALNGKAYILDGLQPSVTDKSKPYSTRLYAAFERTNLPARVMWNEEDGAELWFGDDDGNIYEFYTDLSSLSSYEDDGKAVGGNDGCCWTTPDYGGRVFYQTKAFRWLAVELGAASATGVDMYGMKKGTWSLLKSDHEKSRYLDFSNLDFSRLTFSCDTTNHTLHTKTKIKNTDKARYRFENVAIDEPFELMAYGIDYTEPGGYYKR